MSGSTKCCSSGDGKADILECNESIGDDNQPFDAQMLQAEIEIEP
jgi:hypothetical protein